MSELDIGRMVFSLVCLAASIPLMWVQREGWGWLLFVAFLAWP